MERRTWIKGLITSAASLAGVAVTANDQRSKEIIQGNERQLGPPPGQLGTKSSFENLLKLTSDTSSRTPLQYLHGTITPSELHFERHHSGVPSINPEKFSLLVHGMVDRQTVFTLSDLKRLPSITRICFLECSGNFRTGNDKLTPQQICGLTSQSEWTGVLLSTLFRETGLQAGSKWLLAEGGDACRMTRSIPLDRALKEGMLVYAQNGEALRPQHGYPLRLLLPGWEGNMSVKWLRRIEVSDQPWMTREETSKYTESVHDKIRQFSFDMDARSIITYPAYPHHVERGWIEIRGIAWSGRGKITRVEVSTDGGKTWQNANLQGPVLDKAHTRFAHIWRWDGSTTEIQSRATDETGYVQPTLKLLREARGARSGYHFNPIMGWILNQDGSVLLNPDA